MEDEKILKYGIYQMNFGNKTEAAKAFMILVGSKDNEIKLQAIDALLSILDQIKDHKVIINLCDQAIRTSEIQQRLDNLAYFQMRKASTWAMKIGGWKYVRKTFKLSLEWFNFSTEEEERRYFELDEKIQDSEKQIDTLCAASFKNAKLADNQKLLGMIYLYRSMIWKNRYSDLKIERMKRSVRYLFHCRLRDMMEYSKSDLRMIDYYDHETISDLRIAIKIFEKVNDKDSVSYCLNNLTNHYLHSYRYLRAIFIFNKLRRSIKGTKDQQLLGKFFLLKSRLFTFNRNMPNYVEEYKDYIGQ